MSRNKVVKQAAFIAPGNKKEVCKIYVKYIIYIIDIDRVEQFKTTLLYQQNLVA